MDSQWSAATAADGRIYYYNNVTKATQWNKPEALMTPVELALAAQPYTEHTTPDGRKYWNNKETKESTWEMPEGYKNALAQGSVPARPPPPAQPAFVAGSTSSFTPQQNYRERDDYHPQDRGDRGDRYERDRERPSYSQSDNVRSSFVPAGSNETEYATFEEAEAAFFKCLKRHDVQPEWDFKKVVAACVTDPLYRAIKDPKDRQIAVEKYQEEMILQDKERMKEKALKLRQDFRTMLKSHPEITYYSRWKTIRPIIEGETIYRSSNDEAEKRQLFLEYKQELIENHEKQEASKRASATDELVGMMQELVVDPYMKWSDALEVLENDERFRNDDKFRTLHKLNLLNVFGDHIRKIEQIAVQDRQKQKVTKFKQERKNRDGFKALLAELRQEGVVRAGAMWKDVYPHLKDDERYDAILGQAGSTPLDFFWDVIEEEDQVLRRQRHEVLDVLDDKRFAMTPQTTLEEFMDVMTSDRRSADMGQENLKTIFEQLLAKVLKRDEEDKHQQERAQRRAVDALRSIIKHLDPPVRISDTWEDVETRVHKTEEYLAVPDPESRRHAFEKVIRRLKEKEAEAAEHDRSRHDRRREPRGRTKHSRTPEPDAYEADRKRAVAEREGRYHKASATGLSPPPPAAAESRSRHGREHTADRERGSDRHSTRERERERERDQFHDRTNGRLNGTYDRERRSRELERERPYISRADPRDAATAKELDYGESGRAGSMSGSGSVAAGGSRRRRVSEAGGDAKRVKREEEHAEEAEEVALKSGSEEGEIEEVEV